MKLENKNISIEINENGQVQSLKKNSDELLYQGDETWKKKFPVIFPSLGISTGFTCNDKEYKMPKHGFWSDLKFDSFFEGDKLVSVSILDNKNLFPQIIDIEQQIEINENQIFFQYSFSNLSKEKAFFQFGLHPGFKIDNSSFLQQKSDQKAQVVTDKLTNKKIDINKLEIKSIPFGDEFDTLIYKEVKFDQIQLVNKKYILEFEFDSNNLQIWKPKNDNFVCIEPWYGMSDSVVNAPSDVSKKEDINMIKQAEKVTFEFSIKIINR